MTIPVYLEAGGKRVFACAVDWPGWCRSGRNEESALEALEAYRGRYAAAIADLGPRDGAFDVVVRVPGNATTDFGAPGVVPELDRVALDAAAASRLAALVDACWGHLDAVAAGAPAELRKGPRGGGRDRDKIREHVLGAEAMYCAKLGIRVREPAIDDREAIAAMRRSILEVVGAPSAALGAGERGWPVRYAARRIAWHVLDHAWEIEDRSQGADG